MEDVCLEWDEVRRIGAERREVERRRREEVWGREADEPPVMTIDGLPYVAADWLQRRVAHAEGRAERWRRAADGMAGRSDVDGRELRRAFLMHALVATYEASRWRRSLAVTVAALERARPGAAVRRRMTE